MIIEYVLPLHIYKNHVIMIFVTFDTYFSSDYNVQYENLTHMYRNDAFRLYSINVFRGTYLPPLLLGHISIEGRYVVRGVSAILSKVSVIYWKPMLL